jgi:hypothetical protein
MDKHRKIAAITDRMNNPSIINNETEKQRMNEDLDSLNKGIGTQQIKMDDLKNAYSAKLKKAEVERDNKYKVLESKNRQEKNLPKVDSADVRAKCQMQIEKQDILYKKQKAEMLARHKKELQMLRGR